MGSNTTVQQTYASTYTATGDGYCYPYITIAIGSLASKTFTINGVSKEYGITHPIKRGDVVKLTVKVNPNTSLQWIAGACGISYALYD